MENTLDKYTPNFIFNNGNALFDYGLIIEEELPYIVAERRYDEITLIGRSQALHSWYGDYEPYTLKVQNISIPFENLGEVKRWLRGNGKLISHNDPDKYLEVICKTSREYLNEWGTFYKFDIEFVCQPLKRKVNEGYKLLNRGDNIIWNDGDEKSAPYFEIDSNGGDITISIGDSSLTLINTFKGILTVDNQTGKYIQNNFQQRSKGKWVSVEPGENNIKIQGNINSAKVLLRSVFL